MAPDRTRTLRTRVSSTRSSAGSTRSARTSKTRSTTAPAPSWIQEAKAPSTTPSPPADGKAVRLGRGGFGRAAAWEPHGGGVGLGQAGFDGGQVHLRQGVVVAQD